MLQLLESIPDAPITPRPHAWKDLRCEHWHTPGTAVRHQAFLKPPSPFPLSLTTHTQPKAKEPSFTQDCGLLPRELHAPPVSTGQQTSQPSFLDLSLSTWCFHACNPLSPDVCTAGRFSRQFPRWTLGPCRTSYPPPIYISPAGPSSSAPPLAITALITPKPSCRLSFAPYHCRIRASRGEHRICLVPHCQHLARVMCPLNIYY